MVHTNPCFGVSYREERGALERLRENLERVDIVKSLRVEIIDKGVDLRMTYRP